MKLLDEKKRKAVLNITPLIDVLFILIIFFTITSTFLEQPGMKLDLPKAESAQTHKVEKAIVYLTEDSKLFLQDQELKLDNLKTALLKLMEGRADKSLIISADEGVQHGLVVQVMDIARSSKVEKLVISTEPK